MSSSGFEGFEKRLELSFSLPSGDGARDRERHGLRLLSMDALQATLDAAQCAVVSAVGNAWFDAYVLSESSLFVYPSRAVLKTCGATRLLRALPVLLRAAAGELELRLRSCRYLRGAYLFPAAQPFPHADFADEVRFLDAAVVSSGLLRHSAVLPSSHHRRGCSHQWQWHVYLALSIAPDDDGAPDRFTVEVCMTELDRALARRFYLAPGDAARTGHAVGDEMTALSGLGSVTAARSSPLTCAYAFAPCGYSMNALDGARYATGHVTPEDGHSYASYECGGDGGGAVDDALASVRRAVAVFRPAIVSVSACFAATAFGSEAINAASVWSAVADALQPLGLVCRSQVAEEFPGATAVTYQTFTPITNNAIE